MDMNIDQIRKLSKEYKNDPFDVFTELEEFIKSEEMIMKPYIEAFKNACSNHDWFFQMSDDHQVWSNGCKTEDSVRKTFLELKNKVKELELDDEEFLDILNEVFDDKKIYCWFTNEELPDWVDSYYNVYNPYYQTFYSLFDEIERKKFMDLLDKYNKNR